MSTSYTSKELIDFCLEKNFEHNCIRHLRCRENWPLRDLEFALEIKGQTMKIIGASNSQDKLRVGFVWGLFTEVIKKHNLNLDCKIIISAGDGVAPDEKYTRLCFSAAPDSNHIQIPDPHIFRYINNPEIVDTLSFKNKQDKLIFVGSDTGAINDNLTNQRIDFCHAPDLHPRIYAKVTNFVHFNKEMLGNRGIDMDLIGSHYCSIQEQLKYKYILNIDGNTNSFDRIPWAMNSNSLLIHLQSSLCNQVSWYHPFILKERILPTLCKDSIIQHFNNFDELAMYFEFSAAELIEKQKNFAGLILDVENQMEYLKRVLEKYNGLYNS